MNCSSPGTQCAITAEVLKRSEILLSDTQDAFTAEVPKRTEIQFSNTKDAVVYIAAGKSQTGLAGVLALSVEQQKN